MRAGNRCGAKRKSGYGDRFGGVRLLGSRAPFEGGTQTAIALKNHFALKALRDGSATDYNMARLGHALNVGLVLCELGVEGEHLATMQAAQSALLGAASRSRAAGRWTVSDGEFHAICGGLQAHDAQLERASVKEIAAAESEITRRVACGDAVHTQGESA